MSEPGLEQPVTIAVTGTHSTGKSTFLARLAHELRRQQIQVATVADLGEQAQRLGLPILFNHTWLSTLWIITRGISMELEARLHADVVLIDRPVPDALAYYLAALEYRGENIDRNTAVYLESLVRSHSQFYDLVFRTIVAPTIPLGANKTRDSNSRFRLLADRQVGHVLSELALPHDPLPADGHDIALHRALEFIASRLHGDSTPELEVS